MCGNRARNRSIGAAGRSASVRTTWQNAVSAAACAGSARRSSRRPRREASGRCTGAGTCSTRETPCAAEVDQPGPLAVVLLGERVRERRAAVADGLGEPLLAVQVAERGVGEAVEQRLRHRADAADPDVALAVARGATGDEGVRRHDRAGAGPACAGRRGPGTAAAPRTCWWVARTSRASAAIAGSRYGSAYTATSPCSSAQQHRPVQVGDGGAHVQTGALGPTRPEPEPLGGVVVAAGDDDLRPGVEQPVEGVVEQAHGVDRRQRAVVHVAGHDHRLDGLGPDHLDQVVEEPRLRGEQVDTVEGTTEVPVRGVQQPHAPTVGTASDIRRDRVRRGGCVVGSPRTRVRGGRQAATGGTTSGGGSRG